MEPGYIRDYGRYVGRRSLSANIGEEQLRTIEAYIDREDGWTLGGNCSRWSLRLWNAVVEEDFALKTQTLAGTGGKSPLRIRLRGNGQRFFPGGRYLLPP